MLSSSGSLHAFQIVDHPAPAVLDATKQFDARIAAGASPKDAYQATLQAKFHSDGLARASALMRSQSRAAMDLLTGDTAADACAGAAGMRPSSRGSEELLLNLAHGIPAIARPEDRPPVFRRLLHMQSSRAATLTVLARVIDALPAKNRQLEVALLNKRAAELPPEERTPELDDALLKARGRAGRATRTPLAQRLNKARLAQRFTLFRAMLAHAAMSGSAEDAMRIAIGEVRDGTRPAGKDAQARFDAAFAEQTNRAITAYRTQRPIETAEHVEFARAIGQLDPAHRLPALLALIERTPMERSAFTALAESVAYLPAEDRVAGKNAISGALAGHFKLTPGEPFLHKSYVAQRELDIASPRFGEQICAQTVKPPPYEVPFRRIWDGPVTQGSLDLALRETHYIPALMTADSPPASEVVRVQNELRGGPADPQAKLQRSIKAAMQRSASLQLPDNLPHAASPGAALPPRPQVSASRHSPPFTSQRSAAPSLANGEAESPLRRPLFRRNVSDSKINLLPNLLTSLSRLSGRLNSDEN